MTTAPERAADYRWVVFVRGVSGDADIYGIYKTETNAQRVADRVNRLLPQEPDSDAWSYAMPVYHATTARAMARRATT